MQNWLSSQSGEAGLTVGSPLTLTVDRKRFNNKALKVSRVFLKAEHGKPRLGVPLETGQFRDADQPADAKDGAPKVEVKVNGQPAKAEVKVEVKVNGQPPDVDGKVAGQGKGPAEEGVDTFTFTKSMEPGLYLTRLYYADARDTDPGAGDVRPHIQRGHETRGQAAAGAAGGSGVRVPAQAPQDNQIAAPEAPNVEGGPAFVNRPHDLSELPWFFVLFLGILVAEQALAVHLSFHLRGTEAELPSQAVSPHAAGKAA